MKKTVWKLFEETGNPAYYMLYKELSKDGRNHASDCSTEHGHKRKR